MQLYNEQCEPVWIYQYTTGSEEGISRLREFISTRELGEQEIQDAIADYEIADMVYRDRWEEIRCDYWDGLKQSQKTVEDLKEERQLRQEALEKPGDLEDFLQKRFNLLDFEPLTF